MYKYLIRPILFIFNPETVHHFTVMALKFFLSNAFIRRIVSSIYKVNRPVLEKELFGIKFPNPVGLAAGFDKDANLIDELATFGFGFIEIGTLTPKGQVGNPQPRLFRLPKDQALINRMGFNNEGVIKAVERLKSRNSKVIVGGNIGKNKETENRFAYRDYEYCFEALYDVVDYFVVNVSSPNTPDLRELQEKEPLKILLETIKGRLLTKSVAKPLLLKIAPDLTVEQLDDVIEIVKEVRMDGIIATNTTVKREGLKTTSDDIEKIGAGGLSGRPISKNSTEMIKYLRKKLGPDFPIIGVGGIFNAKDALDKLNAGANLVQVYTGFIYEGPSMVKNINRTLAKELNGQRAKL
ncbi:MAG: quinone-dependent dihydroorotate dehydrogenase [Bacteroidetes bacterium]|nr:quinone-dependent dihydroorotate dehydrogenase [Bacteroidota bacterium]